MCTLMVSIGDVYSIIYCWQCLKESDWSPSINITFGYHLVLFTDHLIADFQPGGQWVKLDDESRLEGCWRGIRYNVSFTGTDDIL